jgi:hypothetical protein
MFPSRDLCRGRSRSASCVTSLDPILGVNRGSNWRRIMFLSCYVFRVRSRSPIGGTSLNLIQCASRDPIWSTIMFLNRVVSGSESESDRLYYSGSDSGCEARSKLEFDYVSES